MTHGGRPLLAIPGPSVVPDRVLRAMHRASPDIYQGELVGLTEGILAALARLAGTRGDPAIYIGNGHAAWEASLANLVAPGDRVLALVTGNFGRGWAAMAQSLGAEVEMMDFGLETPADPARVEARLRADDPARPFRLVLAVQTDTATSVRSDLAAIRAALDAAGHGALLLADCVASMGCDRFAMDAMGVDAAIAASQKGLMGPPGLCFVWVGERARAARARVPAVSPYWDWAPRIDPDAFWRRFGGTPPAQGLYGLAEALAMIEEEGLEAVWARHERLARATWAAADAWGEPLAVTVPDPRARSHAVTALRLPGAETLRAWCAREAGVTLGIGLGRAPAADFFRLGHMGHVNAHMVLGTLGSIEAGLWAMGLAPGGGVAAAARSLAAGAPA